MITAVLLFLVAMAVLALFGRLRRPKSARRCRRCGAPLIGSGPCPCGGKG